MKIAKYQRKKSALNKTQENLKTKKNSYCLNCWSFNQRPTEKFLNFVIKNYGNTRDEQLREEKNTFIKQARRLVVYKVDIHEDLTIYILYRWKEEELQLYLH